MCVCVCVCVVYVCKWCVVCVVGCAGGCDVRLKATRAPPHNNFRLTS